MRGAAGFPQHNRFWIDAAVRRATDDFDASIRGYLSEEHRDDGGHGNVTADSIAVLGALTVTGAITITGAAVFASSVTIQGSLTVTGQSNLGSILSAGQIIQTANGTFLMGTTLVGSLTKAVIGINTSDKVSIDSNAIGASFGADVTMPGPLTITGSSTDDTLAVVASRSGDVVSAYIKNTGGTAASTTSRLSIGQTDSESNAIQIIFNHNSGVATFFNRLTTTGTVVLKTTAGTLTMSNGGDIDISGGLTVDTNTLAVDATNNRVGIGTASPAVQLHTTGAVRFEALAGGGFVTTDGSGNLSMTTPGLTPGSFTTVDGKTVSYNGDGVITSVV